MRIALATYERAPELAPDDQLLVPAFAAIGVSAEARVWSQPRDSWADVDAVVIRSCWDYHLRFADWLDWLARLESDGVPCLNPPSLVRWNANKRYLLDLARRGVSTIPTTIVPRGSAAADVEAIATLDGDTKFVIKPAVSASGYHTFAFKCPLDQADRDAIERVTAAGDALLQPFVDEVPRRGEHSLIFIDGSYSHAALKRAAAGDFRVQVEHGGSAQAIEDPAPNLVAAAAKILAAAPERPLYARVDGIVRGDSFALMELELIEPHLFFGMKPGAADRFARAAVDRLR